MTTRKIKAILGGWFIYLFGFGNMEQRVEREFVCYTCPFEKKSVCTKCGCVIPAKAAWPEEKCPENKWKS